MTRSKTNFKHFSICDIGIFCNVWHHGAYGVLKIVVFQIRAFIHGTFPSVPLLYSGFCFQTCGFPPFCPARDTRVSGLSKRGGPFRSPH